MLGITLRPPSALAAACLLFLAAPAQASDLKAWRLLASSAPLPPALGAPTGVYDPVRQRVLAIDASLSNRPVVIHTFEPSPEPRWSTLAVSGTPPNQRYLANLVYDPARDRILLIGSPQWLPVEVWALPLTGEPEWQKLVTSGDPSARYGQSTIYDPILDRLVMFGGMTYSSPIRFLAEAWALSLASGAWTVTTPGGPAPGGREGHGALYDPERRRMIVFGGHYEGPTRAFWNDCWELNLDDTLAWAEIPATGPLPGARSAFGTVYDPVRRRMLVHGGINAQSEVEPDDLWALSKTTKVASGFQLLRKLTIPRMGSMNCVGIFRRDGWIGFLISSSANSV